MHQGWNESHVFLLCSNIRRDQPFSPAFLLGHSAIAEMLWDISLENGSFRGKLSFSGQSAEMSHTALGWPPPAAGSQGLNLGVLGYGKSMRAEDVTDTLDMALAASGCDQAHVHHRPRLLSDNGPCYIASDLADYIEAHKMKHVRGAPFHPQTQGKIERWHQTMKNRILLENYFLPDALECQIKAFVEHYNHRRYHESLDNVTPADAYFGRAATIIKQRERIKRQTIEHRRLLHRKLAA
jgi:hypothetical protein